MGITRSEGEGRQFTKCRQEFAFEHRAVTMKMLLRSGFVGRSPATLEKRIPTNNRRNLTMKNFMNLASVAAVALTVSAAQGALIFYSATLDGPSEAPPNGSPGSGTALFTFDTVTHMMSVHVDFGGLISPVTAAHIHGDTVAPLTGTAGVAMGMIGFPTGVSGGSYDHDFFMLSAASYSGGYLASHGGTAATAEDGLLAAMGSGKAYLNIHSSAFPGGEIRGFIHLVPAPGMIAMAGLCGLMTGRRRR